jgi:hypothetical protein
MSDHETWCRKPTGGICSCGNDFARSLHKIATSPASENCPDCATVDPTQAADPCVDRLVALITKSLAAGGCSNCGGLPHTTTCRVGRLASAFAATTPASIERCVSCDEPATRTDQDGALRCAECGGM